MYVIAVDQGLQPASISSKWTEKKPACCNYSYTNLWLQLNHTIKILTKNKNMAISDVQEKGSWIYIYNEDGKKSGTLSSTSGELMGVGNDFAVLLKGNWYYVYDEDGKKIATLPSSSGDFKNAIGNSFNLVKGSWVYTFDRKGKKINTKSAR